MGVLDSIANFIADVGTWAVPIMGVLGGVYAACRWIIDAKQAKNNAKKDDAMIELLDMIVKKDDCSKAVEQATAEVEKLQEQNKALQAELTNIQTQMVVMAQMYGTVFENSSIPKEAKERLTVLKDKMEYGIDTDYLDKIEAEKTKLASELDVAKAEIAKLNNPKEVVETTAKDKAEVVVPTSVIV